MKNIDYIVVGLGLASITFCEKLRKHNKTFVVFDDASQKSSMVASGLYNPVVLKRFTPVWKASEQLKLARSTYQLIEKNFNIKIDHRCRILRRFASVEEQNLWFNALDRPVLEPYLKSTIINNSNPNVDAPFGFGQVQHTGWLDTKLLIQNYQQVLERNNCFRNQKFEYNAIKFQGSKINYYDLTSTSVVFAEGFGIKQNPYFNYLPLNGTKGEVINIKAPKLFLNDIVKASVFIIPKGNHIYTVGATYNWNDKSNLITELGKQELLTKIKTFITCNVEVIDHEAGIRPTVKDRRPLVGRHPKFKQLYVLNGLGTRGVMIGPYVSEALFNCIENRVPLDDDININRFEADFYKSNN